MLDFPPQTYTAVLNTNIAFELIFLGVGGKIELFLPDNFFFPGTLQFVLLNANGRVTTGNIEGEKTLLNVLVEVKL